MSAAQVAGAASTDHNRPPRASAEDLVKIEERRTALFQVMLDNPGNLDAAFEYAALSSQVGDLEGAIATLERMLIFAPGLPRLQLELGVLYFRLGAYETARTYFDAAVAVPDVPEEVRQKVATYLAAIDQKSDGVGVSGSYTVGTRYQTNANGGPTSSLVNLRGFGYELSDDARRSPDANVFVNGEVRSTFDLPAQGVEFKLSGQGQTEFYKDRSDLNLGFLEVTAGPSFDLNRFGLEGYSLDLYGVGAGAVLSGDPFLASFGAGALLGARPTTEVYYGLRGEYRHETFFNSDDHPTMAAKSGDRFQLQMAGTYRLTPSVSVGLAGIADRFRAEAAYNTYWQVGGVAGFSIDYASPIDALPGAWNFAISSQLSRRVYDGADPMVSTDSQDTTKWAVNLTQTIPIETDLAAQLQAGYQHAWSNYDTSKSDNFFLSIGLKKVF
ncbi:M48 family metallopeptidase [Pleomorphomonas sp. JP5]|uniref:tetratricopeptide repeat protein n=1 Tax=Pleomorphomonas sp. JP5 TaxID=2942998 RepID=UPI002042C43B|nr:tetratricopeptide repeat protein [Pleomorphomonas sp. JP5]MCM5558959.1 tetratricopeptide repeat protein [Pleomorphomonas sp. JP5]